MKKVVKGRVWRFGDDVDTDQIYPGKYLPLTDKAEMARHAMEGVPGREDFPSEVEKGDIVVAGRNFGCGSSREHAPIALREAGVALVVAGSFARIFYRNAVNVALPVLESEALAELPDGTELEVDVLSGRAKDLGTSREYSCSRLSGLELDILKAGGLLEYLKKKG